MELFFYFPSPTFPLHFSFTVWPGYIRLANTPVFYHFKDSLTGDSLPIDLRQREEQHWGFSIQIFFNSYLTLIPPLDRITSQIELSHWRVLPFIKSRPALSLCTLARLPLPPSYHPVLLPVNSASKDLPLLPPEAAAAGPSTSALQSMRRRKLKVPENLSCLLLGCIKAAAVALTTHHDTSSQPSRPNNGSSSSDD